MSYQKVMKCYENLIEGTTLKKLLRRAIRAVRSFQLLEFFPGSWVAIDILESL